MKRRMAKSHASLPPTDRSDSEPDEDEDRSLKLRPPKERMLGYNYV